ncbi:hypothetical protein MMC14_004314 [Varicellaria rhodocarpa]|nr:hypothetical protein [Varicellaria rhodocarpa]
MSRIIPLNTTFSDGSVTTHPQPTATLVVADNEAWERLVAQELMKQGGDPQYKECVLSALPAGYQLYYSYRAVTTSAPGDPYFFGHPDGGKYRAAKEFVPHFEWLDRADPSTGGRPTGPPCVCHLCVKQRTKEATRRGDPLTVASLGGLVGASSANFYGPANQDNVADWVASAGGDPMTG